MVFIFYGRETKNVTVVLFGNFKLFFIVTCSVP